MTFRCPSCGNAFDDEAAFNRHRANCARNETKVRREKIHATAYEIAVVIAALACIAFVVWLAS